MGRDSRPRSREQQRRSPREQRRRSRSPRRRSPSLRRRSPSPRGRDRRCSPSLRDAVRDRRHPPSPRDVRDRRSPPPRSRSQSSEGQRPGGGRREDGEKDGKPDLDAAAEDGEAVTEIVDGVPRVNGDLTWQAQIYVPRPGVVYRPGQKPVTLCIRGPSRPSKEDAQDDARKLEGAFKDGGIKEVRRLRSVLNNDAGRGGWGM
mmetsp:Transcript_45125/g.104335  ORF Transcript_45125/g.104335 Transcript_45125/m.104335 type:complete len:203 (+) Transcript_45125:40-648(+)